MSEKVTLYGEGDLKISDLAGKLERGIKALEHSLQCEGVRVGYQAQCYASARGAWSNIQLTLDPVEKSESEGCL